MKHITNFPKLAAFFLGTFLSVLSVSAQALEPIILKVPKNVALPARFDTAALNDWRLAVEEGRTSDEELAISFYQMLLSMEFSSITGAPIFQGSLNAHESRIMLKTLRMSLEHVDKSFPFSFSVSTALMDRQYSLLSALECVRREGDTYLAEARDLSRCGERFGKFQPLISGQEKRQASESVLVFYRLAKFLQSFEKGENVLPFLESYTQTPDGTYCLGFVRKYMSNNPLISRKDLSEYTGFLANF